MNVNIWGCRGSIARSHPSLLRYGGNTPCVEVVAIEEEVEDGDEEVEGGSSASATSSEKKEGSTGEDEKKKEKKKRKETRIVLDMGSGAYDLGQKLVKLGPLKDQNILLTHCHWDHIQGFPFFAPLFIPGSHWKVHAPGGFTTSLKDKLASQMSYEFFPLTIDMLGANIDYHDLTEGQFTLGSVKVVSQFLNHPVLTLGYRLNAKDGTSMAYITDHEPFNRAFAIDGYTRSHSINPNDGSSTTPENGDDRHVDFLQGCDLVIHDAQYTAEEYRGKVGWGHGTIEYVTDVAMAAGVKTLALFHHDPQRTDDQVEELLCLAKDRAARAGSTLEIIAAADRSEICLPPKKCERLEGDNEKQWEGSESAFTAQVEDSCWGHHVFICHDNEEVFAGCKEDKLDITFVKEDNGAQWNDVFNSKRIVERPTIFIISCLAKFQECENGIALCQKIRSQICQEVPVFLIPKNQCDMKDYKVQGEDANARVTDWISEPFTPAYIRTRVRMGISRNPCRWLRAETPKNELQRLQALHSLEIPQEPESRYDALVNLARTALGVDAAALNLLEDSFQWTKSQSFRTRKDLQQHQVGKVPRDVSFCSHTILGNDVMDVSDALADYRFADNPQVTQGLKIRFYAGCPISVVSSGESYNVGSLCLMQYNPRKLTGHEKDLLRQFASLLERELTLSKKVTVSSKSIDL